MMIEKKDIVGRVYGKWTVLNGLKRKLRKKAHPNSKPSYRLTAHCKCRCGNKRWLNLYALRKGEDPYCPCTPKKRSPSLPPVPPVPLQTKPITSLTKEDVLGATFGRWLVIGGPERVQRRTKRGLSSKVHVECLCACGIKKRVDMYSLRRGDSKGCSACASRPGRPLGKLGKKDSGDHMRDPYDDLLGGSTHDDLLGGRYEMDIEPHTGNEHDTKESGESRVRKLFFRVASEIDVFARWFRRKHGLFGVVVSCGIIVLGTLAVFLLALNFLAMIITIIFNISGC